MQTAEQEKTEYVLWFVADRLSRTLRYAQSRDATNRPDIITKITEALAVARKAYEESREIQA